MLQAARQRGWFSEMGGRAMGTLVGWGGTHAAAVAIWAGSSTELMRMTEQPQPKKKNAMKNRYHVGSSSGLAAVAAAAAAARRLRLA